MRPAVTVVVPFGGSPEGLDGVVGALARLRLGRGDEVVVADNTDVGVGARHPRIRVVRAARERSSYHARNTGAARTGGEWILFLDADCVPIPALLDAYFAVPPGERCGAVAGDVLGDPGQTGFLARYARSRKLLSQTVGLHEAQRGSAVTANLLLRRAAFADVGGFTEGIRSGGDFDLCRRLLAAGWTIESRPGAVVHHRHREGWVGFLAGIARYAAGARWLGERYPGSAEPWPLVPGLVGSARDVAVNAARGRFEEAGFRAVDGLGLVAHRVGYALPNAPRRIPAPVVR